MSASNTSKTPYEIIEQEKEAYLEELPEPDPDWPVDVKAVYCELQDLLFKMGLSAETVLENCKIDNNSSIYGRFKHFTGWGIREFMIIHRLRFARRLLQHEILSVTQIAFSVGYESSSGFSATFKRHQDVAPTTFRQNLKE